MTRKNQNNKNVRCVANLLAGSALAFSVANVVHASKDIKEYDHAKHSSRNGIIFTDIAAGDENGISYRRTPSASKEIWDTLKNKDIYTATDVALTPTKPRGIPGVTTFDYDNDGDIDIYVTNGPGTANSLYSNQLTETGEISFIDVSVNAGVDASDQDSTGVCFGDIDNDGDHDLYVLGKEQANRLFVNEGNGKFTDTLNGSGLSGGNNSSSSCSFGDINGDGLLDVAISNLFSGTEQHRLPILSDDFNQLVQHNQMFVNNGNNTFTDVSESSGIQTVKGISWSLALVDYDVDGDLDLIVADDQGARTPGKYGGRDAGLIRIYSNNGSGKFLDVSERMTESRFGAWMSLSFGDLNSDGNMDMFASNIGDYMAVFMTPMVDFPVIPGEWNSGWFFGQDDGGLKYMKNLGEITTAPFGWGSGITDYDNDGDQDIIYHGGLDMGPFVDASNPGAILNNNGKGKFNRDATALSESTNHSRRNVNGMSLADLNNDGFIDIVSASNFNWPQDAILPPYFDNTSAIFGEGPFNKTAFVMPTFTPIDPNNIMAGFSWNGIEGDNGTLSVEISNGNENNSVNISLLGTKGLTENGMVNRDGIGAVVMFKPKKGKPVMKPLVSGGSYASQHSMELLMGMGESKKATIEVVWPGGIRNRLYNAKHGEKIIFPEIPCSFADQSLSKMDYKRCVRSHLNELHDSGHLTHKQSERFYKSAIKAFGKDDLYGLEKDISFSDKSDDISFTYETVGSEGLTGAAWIDYDNDEDLDLFLTNGIGFNNGLFQNDGDGNFLDVSAEAGIQNGLGNSGVLAGDIDNDGFTDLFLSSDGGMVTPIAPSIVKLYHNNGDGTFSDITEQSGIEGLITSFSSAFGDINGDGYLDLLISTPGSIPLQRQDRNKLFLNNGDLSFTDISEQAGVDTALGGCLASFTDYDMDGDQDVLIGNCNDITFAPGPIELFRNEGNLAFTNVTSEAGLTRIGGWMGLAITDYDNDGDQDIFASNLGTLPGVPSAFTGTVLYENNGDGTFTDVDKIAGVHEQIWGWGATFTDFNNDGHSDIFYAGSFPFNLLLSTRNPGILFINNKDKTFNRKDSLLGIDLSDKYVSGIAAGDYDNDGFPDLIIASGAASVDGSLSGERIPGTPVLLRNKGNNKHSITVKTIGTTSNRDGIGARVVVKAGELTQSKEVRAGSAFLSTESRWLSFGLNNHEKIDQIDIHWPSGLSEQYLDLDTNQNIVLTEGQGIETGEYKSDED